VPYHWSQWLGFAVWLGVILVAHTQIKRNIPEADPYLLPVAALLTGWGILTIYRLVPSFGIRQTIWLAVCGLVLLLGLRLSPELRFLRRYKYIWLTIGLLLTALTLIFGTDPGGGYEHAWLGCCGVYFQPSEPLKLLLIVYLAAYLADRLPLSLRTLPLLAPQQSSWGSPCYSWQSNATLVLLPFSSSCMPSSCSSHPERNASC